MIDILRMAKEEKFLEKNYDLPDGSQDAPITRAVLKARGVKGSGSAFGFIFSRQT